MNVHIYNKNKIEHEPYIMCLTKRKMFYVNMSAHQLNIPDESLHVDVYQSLSEPVVEDCPPVLCGGFQGTEAQRFKTLKHT